MQHSRSKPLRSLKSIDEVASAYPKSVGAGGPGSPQRVPQGKSPGDAERQQEEIAQGYKLAREISAESERTGRTQRKGNADHPAMKLRPPETSHEHLLHAIEKSLPPSSEARRRFDDLCVDGCPATGLFARLQLLVFSAHKQPKSVYDLTKTSRSALVKLPGEIEQIAQEIGKARPLMGMFWVAKFINNDQVPLQTKRERIAQDTLYSNLPELLRVFATNLRITVGWIDKRFGLKRYDSFRGEVLRLLRWVDNHTGGGPHCAHLSYILVHLIGQDNERDVLGQNFSRNHFRDLPDLLKTPEALRQFYFNSSKYGFRSPKRQNRIAPA
jgi:hypothetical protein